MFEAVLHNKLIEKDKNLRRSCATLDLERKLLQVREGPPQLR